MNKTLLDQFNATGVSYTVAAKDIGIARSSLHAALHGGTEANRKKIAPLVRKWLVARKSRQFYKTGRQIGWLQKNGLTIADAAAVLSASAIDLQKSLESGEWKDEAEFRRFQKYIEQKKQGGKPKMLTNQALPEDVREYFGLKRDPFNGDVQEEGDLFDLKELIKAEKKIRATIDKNGWCCIAGDVGTGKTTMIRKLRAKLAGRKEIVWVEPKVIQKQHLTANHLCLAILADLGVVNVGTRRDLESRARMVGHALKESARDGRKPVLLIDEAHLLRNDAILSLKRLAEFQDGYRKLFSIVLIGQLSLARRLKTDMELREVAQRIDLFEIGGVNGQLGQYLEFKLSRAGLNGSAGSLFDRSALKVLGDRAETLLDLNNLAAAALLRAHEDGERSITGETIKSVTGF